MKVKFCVGPNGTKPTRGTKKSAGYDLYLAQTVDVLPYQVTKCFTDLKLVFPQESPVYAKIESRSGLAAKKNLFAVGGIMDQDYTGEYIVLLANCSNQVVTLEKGERIAQLIFKKYEEVEFEEIESVEEYEKESERKDKGFGSTG
jgi:dUTP pyrophosphatase